MELEVDQVDHAVVTAKELFNDEVVDGVGPVWSAGGVLGNGTASVVQVLEDTVNKHLWVRNHE